MATATRYFVLVLKITTAQNNFSYVSQLDGDDDEYRYRTCTRRGQIECAHGTRVQLYNWSEGKS